MLNRSKSSQRRQSFAAFESPQVVEDPHMLATPGGSAARKGMSKKSSMEWNHPRKLTAFLGPKMMGLGKGNGTLKKIAFFSIYVRFLTAET